MKVLGIGELNLDLYIIEESAAGQQTRRTLSRKHSGGVVGTALLFLARMGVSCEVYASLGQDAEGDIIRAMLARENIALHTRPQKKTQINTIIVNAATGQRKKIPGHQPRSPLPPLDKTYLQQFDLIIIDRHERPAFYDVIQKKKATTKLLIDPSKEVSDFTFDMMHHAEYPIMPIETLAAVAAHHDMLAALSTLQEICGKPMIITLGELGSLLYDGHRIEFVPSLDIKAVDTCGAGDVFRGAVAYGILKGWQLRDCMVFANKVAGLQCLKIGNATAVPAKEELADSLHRPRSAVSLKHVNEYFKTLQVQLAATSNATKDATKT